MKNRNLFLAWGCLFIVCAGLGFIPVTKAAGQILLTGASVLFFVPPALILYGGAPQERLLVRHLSELSLGLTVGLLILNFLTAFRSEALGNVLHAVLTVVSCPMMVSGSWALSLFLWACLLIASFRGKK